MANYYNDNPALRHYLNHPLMERIVALKERDFADADKYDYAPLDFADAMDSYDKVLEVVGEICGDIIAANAEDVDHEGPRVENGRVIYAEGTKRNLEACRKAGLMGMAMPRRLGGLNFPITPYIMAADIVSRADAGFENLWGLQDCAETIYEFADDAQKEKYIPRVCAGETMSMDLTEPDAGSDLQSVMLKATERPDGTWVLNGVKRFITNGDSDIHRRRVPGMAVDFPCSSTTSATAESLSAASRTRWVSREVPHASLSTRMRPLNLSALAAWALSNM